MLSKGAEEKLKPAQAKTGAELNDKFAADAFKGEMGFGGTAEYYRGAICSARRVHPAPPHLLHRRRQAPAAPLHPPSSPLVSPPGSCAHHFAPL